ncbi:ATP-binding protein [Ciceribacter ferrooxidans]|uniref:ATP-binding protein n=1 Tax=Ciceribacter ferrooxidans TaxID=2509717 RepID=UPI002479EB9A|nr:ATP-binding protein [Ciceribacter ferrooxidans]
MGRQAARLDYSVLYVRMPRLFEDLALARLDGHFPRLVEKLARVQLLILDDWGTHAPPISRGLISSKSSKCANAGNRPSSPRNCRSLDGMR